MIRFDTKKDMEHYDNLYHQIYEKDKEIERLSKEVDMWNRKYNEQIDIINELEKELDKGFEVYICNGRKVSKSIELGYKICQKELLRKLKALKEGKE